MTGLLPSSTSPIFAAAALPRPEPQPDLVPGVVPRLYREFELLPLSVIVGVVSGCLRDIQASPPAALPELIERLARQRLTELVPGSVELR